MTPTNSEETDDSVQVCKCGLLLSRERPVFACDRCRVTWKLDAEKITRALPFLKPTHSGTGTVN